MVPVLWQLSGAVAEHADAAAAAEPTRKPRASMKDITEALVVLGAVEQSLAVLRKLEILGWNPSALYSLMAV